ncbi:hypothetical protein IAR55_005069 [Kwoniella newhampshirensis]|uniref:tRNA (guanine(37)-N1)-methyltransferase n=1 Tax=Kwoniella newhampshirensis TaxID=1651941 RepID=A0AAW0YJA8_9TREE
MSYPPSSSSSSSSSKPMISLQDSHGPPQRIGMQTLDRSAFDVQIRILSAVVEASKVGKLRPHPAIRDLVLDLPKVKLIVDSTEEGERGLKLLRLQAQEESDLPSEALEVLKAEAKGFRHEIISMGYENWSPSEILAAVLPTTKSDDIPSSFTSTGHIGHMNLREEWLPYRRVIGQVILDKNPGLRTVVNKLDTIHAQYRYFDMEVIAGDQDYITSVNESNCIFTFDFSRVYWNSRLHGEHDRLISLFAPQSIVADVMAGVGPFVVPAAKRGAYVLGNDLNPEGVKWMRENRLKNHVEETLRVFEMDGHNFISFAVFEAWENPFKPSTTMSKNELRKRQKEARKERERLQADPSSAVPPPQVISSPIDSPIAVADTPSTTPVSRTISHFIMNLPDSALSFLGAYSGCYTPLLSLESFTSIYGQKGEGVEMPIIHCYCFTREIEREKAEPDILQRASEYLSYDLTPNVEGYNLHHVRSVAPNKDMYCLEFRLPREIAFRPLTASH